ncbi:MAG: FlgD immunoglobulin-like domain containing protein [Solirubrobacteraceae bacterium]
MVRVIFTGGGARRMPRMGGLSITCLRAAIAGLCLLMSFAASACADPAGPFATITGTVAAGSLQVFTAAPVATAHSNVVFRVTENGSQGFVNFAVYDGVNGDMGEVFGLAPTDVAWQGAGVAYAPGDIPEIQVNNWDSSPVAFSVEFFDEPSSPASYSGSSFQATTGPNCCSPSDDSQLLYSVPGTATYVADVTLSGGAIQLEGGNSSPETFDSSGQYSLGQISPSSSGAALTVDPVAGPAAQWTISIQPVPVSVSGANFNQHYAQSGAIDTLSYTTSGSTTISAVVTNAGGQTVRTLATNLAVQPGAQSLTWDGRNDGGNPLPDGNYTATITSTDPFGNISTTTASIFLDSTPPTVHMTSPATIRLSQAASFGVVDQESGVASISLTIDGQDVDDFGGDSGNPLPANGVFSYPGPWSFGQHTWQIQATDNAGNQATVSGQFDATAPIYINCEPNSSPVAFPAFQPRQHPSSCNITGEPEDEANFIGLRKASWSNWGTGATTASGIALNNHPGMGGPASYSLLVRLYRIRVGCAGREYYTRSTITYTRSRPGDTLRSRAMVITASCNEIPIPLAASDASRSG